ncbi:MAG: hypothetical protein ACD_21C00150G0001 [uncultured bacterium]|nr:MAG: hypothetical protein ACD_21C00150G0001 [uncultured bacterium]
MDIVLPQKNNFLNQEKCYYNPRVMRNKMTKIIVLICINMLIATSTLAIQTTRQNIYQPQSISLSAVANTPQPSIIAPQPKQTTPPQLSQATVPNTATSPPTTPSLPAPTQPQQPYMVELQVSGNSEEERKQSFTAALEQVIAQNSKDPKITTLPTIKTALSNPSAYVQRYTYVPRNNATGQPIWFLQIQFNQTAVTQLLQLTQAAPPKPIADKNQALVWLVKDVSGNKIMEDESSNDMIVPVLQKNAQTFGLPILLPVSDLQEVNRIKAEDICNLNAAAIKDASKRYGTNTIVAGCIKQPATGNVWTSQWILLRDNRSDNFNFTGITANDVIMQATRALAPIITNASQQSASQSKKLTLRITNVNDLNQYNEVVRYLTTFSQVAQVDLAKLNATEVELSINTIGDSQALLTALNAQTKLVRNTDVTTSPTGVDLDYKWVTASNEQSQAISAKPVP